jgi:hypothetical protein
MKEFGRFPSSTALYFSSCSTGEHSILWQDPGFLLRSQPWHVLPTVMWHTPMFCRTVLTLQVDFLTQKDSSWLGNNHNSLTVLLQVSKF